MTGKVQTGLRILNSDKLVLEAMAAKNGISLNAQMTIILRAEIQKVLKEDPELQPDLPLKK